VKRRRKEDGGCGKDVRERKGGLERKVCEEVVG
jgi:hypothetical protein